LTIPERVRQETEDNPLPPIPGIENSPVEMTSGTLPELEEEPEFSSPEPSRKLLPFLTGAAIVGFLLLAVLCVGGILAVSIRLERPGPSSSSGWIKM
jgi:hypothetical protein